MTKFVITYIDIEGFEQEVEKEFEATENLTAREWAEDYAYTVADKGVFDIEDAEDE